MIYIMVYVYSHNAVSMNSSRKCRCVKLRLIKAYGQSA